MALNTRFDISSNVLQSAIYCQFSEDKCLIDFVKIALRNGANPLHRNMYNETALHIALNNMHNAYLKEISILIVKHILLNDLEIPQDLQNDPKIIEISESLSEQNKRATAAFILGCKDKKNSMLYKFFNGPLSDENIIREIHSFKPY